ncbi:putative fatty acyl-CoA reductase CG5065 [Trichoplusia ni]|nr:putative fatty acyl-CoA reductase CG5065 [Trichoplusia ni]XP_026732885.1 putative fatty acyl-CoA reductase CG5065 [Trichoplusia ni]
MDKSELGLSSEDQERLINEVSVVFHVAASVNLDADLRSSMATNFFGTSYVLKLCHRMKKIKVFVYVSTAYCNSTLKVLEEKVYPVQEELEEVLKYLEEPHLDRDRVKKLLNGRPNAYALSKALAEHYVAQNHGDIPIIFIRPSIVISSSKEPVPGWVDSFQGATALITAVLKGVNRVIYGNKNNVLDLIPVDYVSNLSIVAAARVKSSKEVTVYNCCTSSIKPITLKELASQITRRKVEDKQRFLFLPTVFFSTHWLVVIILTFVMQIMPSFIADQFLYFTGNKPMYMKIQSKVINGRNVLNYYTNNSWVFKSVASRRLLDTLSLSDKRLFPCYPSDLNWDKYFKTYFDGIENFLLKK